MIRTRTGTLSTHRCPTHLMIKGGLILDDLHSNFFTGILSTASHDLPEGALPQHVPDDVPVPNGWLITNNHLLLTRHRIRKCNYARQGLERYEGWKSSQAQNKKYCNPPSFLHHQDVIHIQYQIIIFVVVAIIPSTHPWNCQASPAPGGA